MDKLGRPGHYTLFAPTNDAFENLSPGHLERMMGDKDVIAGMLDALTAHEEPTVLIPKSTISSNCRLAWNVAQTSVICFFTTRKSEETHSANMRTGNWCLRSGSLSLVSGVKMLVFPTWRELMICPLRYPLWKTSISSANVSDTRQTDRVNQLPKLGRRLLPGFEKMFVRQHLIWLYFAKSDCSPAPKRFKMKCMQFKFQHSEICLSHQALVNYHLLNSAQCSEAIMAGSVFETAEGSTIEIGCDGDSLTVNGIKMVLKKDIVTSNGVIHLIRQVLIPDAGEHAKADVHISLCWATNYNMSPSWLLSAKEGLELIGDSQMKFSNMVSEVGLAAAMRPKTEYTILAPVNAAFSSELFSKQILCFCFFFVLCGAKKKKKAYFLFTVVNYANSCSLFEVVLHQIFKMNPRLTAPMLVCVRWGDVNRQEQPEDHFGKPYREAQNYSEWALQWTVAGNTGWKTAPSLHLPHSENLSCLSVLPQERTIKQRLIILMYNILWYIT